MNTNEAKELNSLMEVISSSTRTNDSILTELTESLSYMTDYNKDALTKLSVDTIKELRSVLAPLTEASDKLLGISKSFQNAISPNPDSSN